MKWITRSHVHVDRVACPWLITRFIDSDAEFLFAPKKKEQLLLIPPAQNSTIREIYAALTSLFSNMG